MNQRLRPAIKTHGGKFYLASAFMPVLEAGWQGAEYVAELYGGGASVLLQREQNAQQIVHYNDYDPLCWAVYAVLSNSEHATELHARLAEVRCDCKSAMNNSWLESTLMVAELRTYERLKSRDDLYQMMQGNPDARIGAAHAFIVNRRMSRGGMGKDFAWTDRQRGGQAGEINSWKTFVWQHVPRIAVQCRRWVITSVDALVFFINLNSNAFAYLDPPYLKETRTAANVYDYEMTIEQHREMLDACAASNARIAISSYENELYNAMLPGWTRHVFVLPNHSGQNRVKQKRREVLYTNY